MLVHRLADFLGSVPLFRRLSTDERRGFAALAREQRFARGALIVRQGDPGDALYLPKLWWHQVEATSSFNILVNYWWDAFSPGPDQPFTAMMLAMITLAERPAAERAAWRAFFDHYVFRPDGHPLAHMSEDQHGILGPLHPHNYRRLRAQIMQLLRGC